jgi:hypothetical protein
MGENAEFMDSLSNDAARFAQAVSDLDTMYPGTPFSDTFVSGIWENGAGEEFLKGVYSFPAIGTYPTDGSPSMRQVLAQQVGSALYFAGEATDNAHSATVFGALAMGLRAAGEIDADHIPGGGSGGTGGTGGGGTMHVDNISIADVPTQGPWHEGHATITIVDGGGAPVGGASVSASYTGSTSGSISGTTDGSGNVTLESTSNKQFWTGQFCVDDVTFAGSTYDSGANVETCDTLP